MGQQQLLLVILVTIIVGIATVVAINVFGSSAENANADATRQDLLAAATAAQGWFMKPTMLGGGGASYVGVTLADLGIPFDREAAVNVAPFTTVTNANARYILTGISADGYTITAHPATFPFTLTLTVDQTQTDPDDRVVIATTTTASVYTAP